MKSLLIFVGVIIGLYGAYSVVYVDDALTGLLMALLALGIMILTSDSVWREGK